MKDQVGKVVIPELMGRVSIFRKTTSVSYIGVHGLALPVWHAFVVHWFGSIVVFIVSQVV